MKISAVQFRPVSGNIVSNMAKHLEFIELAVTQDADLIFFSELSLTGYEPHLAKSFASSKSAPCLDIFQQCSDRHNIIIGVGLPISTGSQVQIGMIWFTPNAPRQTYAKQQLHPDEISFFVQGDKQLILRTATHIFAPAICYESLQQSHADHAANLGADVYLASVAKPAGGMAKAMLHYAAIARQHKMYVLMANCIGPCDNFVSGGQSAVWNKQGELLVQMDSESEGIVMMDTISNQAACLRCMTL
ncbi:carbon-nitrogen hydrolase family protein [Oscillatoria sp. FACHB-1407]|uniref:carbon-nitrogen hydrolase family protein n=1 Tax=Oscillatoria sp. FACHB-1407 TaxID=2692847 RepID=UPI001681E07F|nr:carbon-nitrogen hydrolase family protein [Oscillatoria sp. FACHB-1407]MBD2465532.1 carbon-nitrogen hydrolase family protein [Oscillatoria sp. FACHB-1407]